MATDEEISIQAIVSTKEAGSLTRAISNAKGIARNKEFSHIEITPTDRFYRALKKTGISEKLLAETLLDLLNCKKVSVDKNGKIFESPDNPIRLKTIELLLKFYAPDKEPSQNHLHLHGKKLDELLNKD